MRTMEPLTPSGAAADGAARKAAAETSGPLRRLCDYWRSGPEGSRPLGQGDGARWPGLPRMGRLIKFLLVGGLGVVINSLALVLLHQLLRLPLVLASMLAVELAIASNFFWNDRWTFGRSDLSIRRFLKFNLVSLGGLAITTGTLWLLVTHRGVAYVLANLVGIGLATCWNFSLSLLWTWGRGR